MSSVTTTAAKGLHGPNYETVSTKEHSWLYNTYPGYDGLKKQWNYVDDHYTGRVIEEDFVETYLIQRAVAEATGAYNERKQIAAYNPLLAMALDSLAGMIQAVDEEAVVNWTDPDNPSLGLGDPQVAGTPAYRLERNINGEGMSRRSFWNCVAVDLLKYTVAYVMIEGIEEKTIDTDGGTETRITVKDPRLKLVRPQDIPNEVYDGRVKERMMTHVRDMRTSVTDDNANVPHWTVYSRDGWVEYTEDKDKNPVMTREGFYEYVDDSGRPVVPIIKLEMPMHRNPAYIAARQCNRILNIESEQQHAVRIGNLSRLVIATEEEEFQTFIANLSNGHSVMRISPESKQGHGYITPGMEPVEMSDTMIQRYTRDFQSTTWQVFGDSLKNVTATEIRQKARSGVEALLATLSAVLDRGENLALFYLEQAEKPGKPEEWGHAKVKRSTKFDLVTGAERQRIYKDLYFPNGPVPLGPTGEAEAAKKIAEESGISVVPEEVEAQVRRNADQRTQDADARQAFGI